MSTITFDIEVAGLPWEEVDESTRDYLKRRERDPSRREAVKDRLALYPGLGKVIAIGMRSSGEKQGTILLEGPEEVELQAWDKVPGASVYRGSEAQLLAKFWQRVAATDGNQAPQLVTYNGRGYDGPVITVRSAQLGIAPSRNLVPDRHATDDHCDLMDAFSFFGATRDRYTLDYWCHRFGVASPKSSIDGSQVGAAYLDGRIEEIGAYCLRDVRATAELFEKVQGSLVPVHVERPH
ncbi:MAG: hypothetical protein ACI8X5_002278 [Planctomycetota bacterium]|jgi:hypothetical protein